VSPFRRVLADQGVRHPAAYSILIVIAGMLVSMFTAVYVSIQASDKAIDRAIQVERSNRLAEEARREEDRQAEAERRKEDARASCQFIHTINDAYQEDPPSSPTGINVTQAWAGLAKRCKALGF
jgi:hypothetical protein